MGEATSARAALWLRERGFARVSVLRGGLDAWREAGFPVESIDGANVSVPGEGVDPFVPGHSAPYIASLAERYLREAVLPARRRLATLFIDIAGSTRLLAQHPPEAVLEAVQRFMRLSTEAAIAYCGDVKDFEGDGALLYFESEREAVQAALAIREALAAAPDSRTLPIVARMSLSTGEVVIGVVGTVLRKAVELIGLSLSVGARLLKQVEPGGFIVTGEVIDSLRAEDSELAARFRLADPDFVVPDAGGTRVATYTLIDPA